MAFKLKTPQKIGKAVAQPLKAAAETVRNTVTNPQQAIQKVMTAAQDPAKAVQTNWNALTPEQQAAVGFTAGGIPGALLAANTGGRLISQASETAGLSGVAPVGSISIPPGSIGSLSGGAGDTGKAYAAYVESLKAQAPVSAFNVSPVQAQQIAGQLSTQSAFMPQQEQLAALAMQRAMGQGGPSPAELMLAQQQDRIRNMALAQAASVSGRAMGAAQRQIGQQQALGAQEALRNAAILRAQEQQTAMADATKALEAGRSGELAQRGQQIQALGMDQQSALEAQKTQASLGLQAQSDAAKLNEQRQQALLQASASGLQNQQAYDLAAARNATDIAMAEFNAREQAKQAEANRRAQMAGAVLQGAGALGASYLGSK